MYLLWLRVAAILYAAGCVAVFPAVLYNSLPWRKTCVHVGGMAFFFHFVSVVEMLVVAHRWMPVGMREMESLLGFAVAGATRQGGVGRADDEVRRLQRLHPTDYPRLTALAPHYLSHLSAESFTGAVEHLIAGFGITDDQEGHHS